MQPSRRTVAVAFILAILVGCGRGEIGPQPVGKEAPPQPLHGTLVASWQRAGADTGWIGVNRFGNLYFHRGENGYPGDLPAFEFFHTWQEGVLCKLPGPVEPFGLMLKFDPGRQVHDVALKELVYWFSLNWKIACLELAGKKGSPETLRGLYRCWSGWLRVPLLCSRCPVMAAAAAGC